MWFSIYAVIWFHLVWATPYNVLDYFQCNEQHITFFIMSLPCGVKNFNWSSFFVKNPKIYSYKLCNTKLTFVFKSDIKLDSAYFSFVDYALLSSLAKSRLLNQPMETAKGLTRRSRVSKRLANWNFITSFRFSRLLWLFSPAKKASRAAGGSFDGINWSFRVKIGT